jgi:hypothetical protein
MQPHSPLFCNWTSQWRGYLAFIDLLHFLADYHFGDQEQYPISNDLLFDIFQVF